MHPAAPMLAYSFDGSATQAVRTSVQLKPGSADRLESIWIAKSILVSEMLKGVKSCIFEKTKYGHNNVHCFNERTSIYEVPIYVN